MPPNTEYLSLDHALLQQFFGGLSWSVATSDSLALFNVLDLLEVVQRVMTTYNWGCARAG
jgi:hypothetical protein